MTQTLYSYQKKYINLLLIKIPLWLLKYNTYLRYLDIRISQKCLMKVMTKNMILKRFDLIVKNLERWKQLSHDEKVAKYNSIREKLKHNFEVFKNARGTFERETVGVLSQLSSQSVDIHNV